MSAFDGKYSPAKIVFDFVERSEKSGEFEQQEFVVTNEDLEELSVEISQLADDIFSGTILSHEPVLSHKTKNYMDLIDMIRGDVVQGRLFEH
jgi:hypothetical protein